MIKHNEGWQISTPSISYVLRHITNIIRMIWKKVNEKQNQVGKGEDDAQHPMISELKQFGII